MMINGLLHLPSPQAQFELAQSSWPFRKTLMQCEPNPPPPNSFLFQRDSNSATLICPKKYNGVQQITLR